MYSLQQQTHLKGSRHSWRAGAQALVKPGAAAASAGTVCYLFVATSLKRPAYCRVDGCSDEVKRGICSLLLMGAKIHVYDVHAHAYTTCSSVVRLSAAVNCD